MKRNIVHTILFFAAMLLLSFTGLAFEKYTCKCITADVAGTWGYSETGTVFLPAPTGAIPYASVGKYTIDANGNVSGSRTASAAGKTMNATISGTATVNPDCTGTLTVDFYDPSTGAFMGSAAKTVVYVNYAREANMILTSTSNPAVLTTVAKKLFPSENALWLCPAY